MPETLAGGGGGGTIRPAFLFVYGTLMQGESRHHFLDPGGIKSITRGSIAGELFDLGSYPGVRLSADERLRVFGELIEFEGLERIIAALDEEEGPDYERWVVEVRVTGGRVCWAWTYVFLPDVEGCRRIASGDWRVR